MKQIAERRSSRGYTIILAIVVILAAALSAGWYYVAGELDKVVTQALARAEKGGATVTCANRQTFGYPFRIGIHCDAVAVETLSKDVRMTAGTLRTAAQIYQPNKVVAELDGPAFLEAGDLPPLDLRWSLGQASATFWTQGADHLSFAFDNPEVALAQPAAGRAPLAAAVRFEAHARRREGDLDIALTDRGVKMLSPELASLPAFDASADLSVSGAADWLNGRVAGRTPAEVLAGRTVTLRALKLESGTAIAEVSGPISVGADGEISGDLKLAVADAQRIAALVAGVAPELAGVAGSVASAITFIGRPEDGRTVIALTIRDGEVAAGVIPLGSIPPLR
ncbi:DUF2125 domain-containing protein [Mangrovicella endophytica]|uniref:DUF2125 domain-containing protein n=1 Tax=Mangrovicella endophytica TaxID=2066697 RepID=UPI00130007D9|nr:DUF2125 domain-containing protein [Mangrovicella endophytica]